MPLCKKIHAQLQVGVKYISVGALAATTEYLVFLCLLQVLQNTLVISQTMSFLTGLVVSFSLNKLWVFGSKARYTKELLYYLALAVVNLVVSNVLLVFMIDHHINALLAKIFVMGLIAVWNFVLFQTIIFTDNKKL